MRTLDELNSILESYIYNNQMPSKSFMAELQLAQTIDQIDHLAKELESSLMLNGCEIGIIIAEGIIIQLRNIAGSLKFLGKEEQVNRIIKIMTRINPNRILGIHWLRIKEELNEIKKSL